MVKWKEFYRTQKKEVRENSTFSAFYSLDCEGRRCRHGKNVGFIVTGMYRVVPVSTTVADMERMLGSL